MGPGYFIGPGQISKRAGDFQHAMIGASREIKPLGGLKQQGLAFPVGLDQFFDECLTGGGIREDFRRAGGFIALTLAGAGCCHA